MKFGGAALQDIDHLKKSCDIIQKRKEQGYQVVVVVSAMGKTTDELISKAHAVHSAPSKRELDMLISAGERMSMALVAIELDSRGISAMSFTGSQAGIVTDHHHLEAKILDVKPFRIEDSIKKNILPVIAGFQGVSFNKEITTLGRGGSDTTAVALAIALRAEVVEFYKDVCGIYTNDPKKDEKAQLIDFLNYDEALAVIEKSGSKLIHPRAIKMAKKNLLPLFIQSFEKENLPQNQNGSWIGKDCKMQAHEPIFEGEDSLCLSCSHHQNPF
jgi:aspartate kinase